MRIDPPRSGSSLMTRFLEVVDERIARRLREAGIIGSRIGGGNISGPIPGTSLPSHDHTGTGSGTGGKLTAAVVDTYVQFEEQVSAPAAAPANTGRLYSKDVAGQTHPYWRQQDGTEFDLAAGAIAGSLDGLTDVTITSAADRQLLINDGSGQWRNYSTNVFYAARYGTGETGIQGAIDAAEAAGGGVVMGTPGVVTISTGLVIDSNVTIDLCLYGVTLEPATGITAIRVTQFNGSGAAGCRVRGAKIDGNDAANTVGLEIRNTDRALGQDLTIIDCAVGVKFHVNNVANWCEFSGLKDCFIHSCTTGIEFVTTAGSGTQSFGECFLVDVGVSDSTTGILIGNNLTVYRSSFRNVVLWVNASQKCLSITGDTLAAVWHLSFESFSGTGTTGLEITSTAFNTERLELHTDWTGTFATPVSVAANKYVVYQWGNLWVSAGTTPRALRSFVSGDSHPRFSVAGDFTGGGGLLLGPGSATTPDVNLYRGAVDSLRTDDAMRPGTFTTAGLPSASGVGAGSIAWDTTESKLKYSDGSVWTAIGTGTGGGTDLGAGGGLELIDDETLGGDAASWTSNTISSKYIGLVLIWTSKSSDGTAPNVGLRCNGDTGSNYDWQSLTANGTTSTAAESLADTSIRVGTLPANTVTDTANGGRIEMLHIQAGNYKQAIGQSVRRLGGATGEIYITHHAGFWRSTAAITTVTLLPASANFESGSRFTLYGIKAQPSDVSARVYNSGNISINNNAVTNLTFDSERFDTDTLHSTVTNTGRLTASRAGKYTIGACINWAAAAASGQQQLALLLNGTTVIAMTQVPGSTVEVVQLVETLYELAANDYIEVRVYQNTGAARNVLAAAAYSPEFWIHLKDGS